MKNLQLIIALSIMTFSVSYAQELTYAHITPETASETTAPELPLNADVSYLGGNEALATYLGENLEYPESARENVIEGTVKVKFVVDKNGNITEVTIVDSPSDVLSDSAKEMVSNMNEWRPARKNGQNVSSSVILPIVYSLY